MANEERKLYLRKWQKAKRDKRREFLQNLLGGKCVRCGIDNGLQFDHIDPSTRNFVIGNHLSYPMALLLAEVAKCQLLCQTCHTLKTLADNGRQLTPLHGTLSRYMGRGHLRCRCDDCKLAHARYQVSYRARRRALA